MTSARPTMRDPAASNTSDREIVVMRVFDSPRALVFKAWTDPKHLAHWWGPNGFSITTYEMEFKPGGVWRFVMHGPDGRDYQNENVYVEIAEPERLVYMHVSEPQVQDDGDVRGRRRKDEADGADGVRIGRDSRPDGQSIRRG